MSEPESVVIDAWCPRYSVFCTTCGEELGGATRGWIDPEDHPFKDVGVGHPSGHEVLVYYGRSRDDDQAEAVLREQWWEHHAHLVRVTHLLASGDPGGAAPYALRAVAIWRDYPALQDFEIILRPREDWSS